MQISKLDDLYMLYVQKMLWMWCAVYGVEFLIWCGSELYCHLLILIMHIFIVCELPDMDRIVRAFFLRSLHYL